MEVPIFPNEIFENILKFCDGETLIRAESVCKDWKQIVSYLAQSRDIWRLRCLSDIPNQDYICMEEKTGVPHNEPKKHEIMFRNWYSWRHNSKIPTVVDLRRNKMDFTNQTKCLVTVTSVKMSGFYIVYSTGDGTVHILNEYGDEEFKKMYIPATVYNLTFLNEKDNFVDGFRHKHLLVAYSNCLVLVELEPEFSETLIRYEGHYSCFKSFICYVQLGGHIKVEKINDKKAISSPENMIKVKYTRFSLSKKILTIGIWTKKVVVVATGQIYWFDYLTSQPVASLVTDSIVTFRSYEKFWIFQNQVVFNAVNAELQIVTILNEEDKLDRKFNCMQTLRGVVSCVLLYGSILFICTSSGSIFLYRIKCWKDFDLENYSQKIDVHADVIHSLDVQEIENENILAVGFHSGLSYVFLRNT